MSDFQQKFKNILPQVGGNYSSTEHFRVYKKHSYANNNKFSNMSISKASSKNTHTDNENEPNLSNWLMTQLEVHGFDKIRKCNNNSNFLSNGNDYSSADNYTNDCVGSVLGSGDSLF